MEAYTSTDCLTHLSTFRACFLQEKINNNVKKKKKAFFFVIFVIKFFLDLGGAVQKNLHS